LWFDSYIITEYICLIIRTTKLKQHIKNLLIISYFINHFFKLQLIPILGLRLSIKGKLNGKLRKSQYIYKIGKTNIASFNMLVCYGQSISFTKYGTFSVSCLLSKLNEFNL